MSFVVKYTMGLSDSKPERLSSNERVVREAAKSDMMQQRKQQIDQAQQQIVSDYAIVDAKEMASFFKATEKAKSQLDRSGDALVKADLIAILITLDPSLQSRLQSLDMMRVTDLNAMIRSIVYDPSRILKAVQQPNLSSQNNIRMLR